MSKRCVVEIKTISPEDVRLNNLRERMDQYPGKMMLLRPTLFSGLQGLLIVHENSSK